MISDFIFGMGTGRCGTWTLSRILDHQSGVFAKHEGVPLPWQVDNGQLWQRLINLATAIQAPKIASVSYVWINYVGSIMGQLSNPRCICLKRNRPEVVASFLEHSPFNNHWTDPKCLCWDPNKDVHTKLSYQWPKYPLPKAEAISHYWDEYYAHAAYLQQRYPDNFAVFDMYTALNTEDGQREMLSFVGIDEDLQVISLNQRLNALHKPKGEIEVTANV